VHRGTLSRSKRLAVAVAVCMTGLVALVQTQKPASGQTLGSNGSLVMYPNASLSWAPWYAGAIETGVDGTLDVSSTVVSPTANAATAIASVPVSALPKVPFIVHTRVINSPLISGPVPQEIQFFDSSAKLISSQPIVVTNDGSPQEYAGASATITPPANAASMYVGFSVFGYNSKPAFAVQSVSVDPVGVTPPARVPFVAVNRNVFEPIFGNVPLPNPFSVVCNGAVQRTLTIKSGATFLNGQNITDSGCVLRYAGDLQVLDGQGFSSAPESPISSGAVGVSLYRTTLKVVDERLPLLDSEWTVEVTCPGSPSTSTKFLSPQRNANPPGYSGAFTNDLSGGCTASITRSPYRTFTYQLNNGPISTATLEPVPAGQTQPFPRIPLGALSNATTNLLRFNPGAPPPSGWAAEVLFSDSFNEQRTAVLTCPTAAGTQSASARSTGFGSQLPDRVTVTIPNAPTGPCKVTVTPVDPTNRTVYDVRSSNLSSCGSGSGFVWTENLAVTVDLRNCDYPRQTGQVAVSVQREFVSPLSVRTPSGASGRLELEPRECGVVGEFPRCKFGLLSLTGTGGFADGDPRTGLAGFELVQATNSGETRVISLPAPGVIFDGANSTLGDWSIRRSSVTPTTVTPTTVAPTTVRPTTLPPTTLPPTTVAPTTVAPTTVRPTTVAPTTVAPTTVRPTTVAPTTRPGGLSVAAPPSAGIGESFTVVVSGATIGAYVDLTIGGSSQGGAFADANGTARITTAIYSPGVKPVVITETTYQQGVPRTRTASATITIGTTSPTTVAPTTVRPTTVPPTTVRPTTVPPTTRPAGFSVVAPASVAAGASFTVVVSGAAPGAFVDLTIGGSSQGGAFVDADGTARITTAIYSPGTKPLIVTETTYQQGVARTRTSSTTITIK
jgi:hypothetical protein